MKNILYLSLKTLGDLASPFINTYTEETLDSKAISFSFSFKNRDVSSNIYLKLINEIGAYNDGFSRWIMHKNYSKKNYTIEPVLYYYLRGKYNKVHVSDFKNKFKQDFPTYNRSLIADLSDLATIIKNISS